MSKFQRIKPMQWVEPVLRGYKMACCDCGLVHTINFKVTDRRTGERIFNASVLFQADRDRRATASLRGWDTRKKKK